MVIKAILWNIIHLDETLRKRKRIQKYRKISDDVLLKNLGWRINWMQYWKDFRRVEQDMTR